MTVDLMRQLTARQLAVELGEDIADRIDRLPGSDASAVDEWHCRAAQATTELAAMANLRPSMRVLDVGSGLGGAARHLAQANGVEVIGIDSSRMYVEVAQELTRRAGLDGRVRFECASAESTPFPTASFDCGWLQHVLPHIIDKARLFAGLRRVIVPGGVLALHEIVVLDGGSLRYPLPWAESPTRSFIPAAARLRIALESAGFVLESWKDTTPAAHEWCAHIARALTPSGSLRPRSPLHLAALHNFMANVEAGRLGVAMGVFRNGRHAALARSR